MKLFSIALLVVFIGCTPTQQIIDPSIPQLLVQSPLPAIPISIENPPTEISMTLFISSDGSVAKAHMVKSTCGSTWDSLAIQTIMQWQFSPSRVDGKAISTWYHLRSPLRYIDSRSLPLAEIVCDKQEIIDSLYKELKLGNDFGELAFRFSVAPSRENKGELGEVNIYCYPQYIRKHLTKLELDEFTPPLKYGDQFIVFKRPKK